MSNEQKRYEWVCGGSIVSPRYFLTAAVCLAVISHLYVILRNIWLGMARVSQVYLLKSPRSNEQRYDEWLCGGSIVSPRYVLTAAACLADVSHLYVIAGYTKYVRPELLDQDECTKNRKQRVVQTCIPKVYSFSADTDQWAAMDIGFAIVENPYNFSDITYRLDCSYVPRPITIYLDTFLKVQDTDALMYGWGHELALRLPGDTTDYNSHYLKVASTKVISKAECENKIKDAKLKPLVARYFVCTSGKGLLNSEGDPFEMGPITRHKGCTRRTNTNSSIEECYDISGDEMANNSTEKIEDFKDLEDSNQTFRSINNLGKTRRSNICVNDHGSPLVSWMGSKEVLLGVASANFFDDYHNCVEPSLFTSTGCTMRFIICSMQDPLKRSRRAMCQNLTAEEGYEIHETNVDWSNFESNLPEDSYVDSFENIENGEFNRRSRIMEKLFRNDSISSTTKTNTT